MAPGVERRALGHTIPPAPICSPRSLCRLFSTTEYLGGVRFCLCGPALAVALSFPCHSSPRVGASVSASSGSERPSSLRDPPGLRRSSQCPAHVSAWCFPGAPGHRAPRAGLGWAGLARKNTECAVKLELQADKSFFFFFSISSSQILHRTYNYLLNLGNRRWG